VFISLTEAVLPALPLHFIVARIKAAFVPGNLVVLKRVHPTTDPGPSRSPNRSALGCVIAAFGVWLLGGCTAAHHRRAADNDVYQIVQQVERQVFGRTNAFTIDTPYSGRKPADIAPDELIEDRLQTNWRVLTIEGALDLAVNNSRRYQAEKENLYLTALGLTGSRHQFSPQFFDVASVRVDRTGAPRIGTQRVPILDTNNMVVGFVNVPVQDSPVTVSGAARNSIGVTKLLKTGGLLGVTLVNDLFRYYTGDPQRTITSLISVDIFQPLLRGFGRNNPAVENLKQAERNMVYAIRDYGFFQEDFAVEVVNDYINLLAQKDNIRNRYTNYLGRVQATKRLEAREDRDRRIDVDQARQAELTAKNNYVNTVATYRNSLDQFKIQLGLPLGEKVFLDDKALDEIEQTGLVPVPLDPEQAYRLAVQRQLPILNAIDRFEDRKRKIRLAADELKPGLDFFADARLGSEGPTDYTEFDPDKIRAGAGFELDLPFDRLAERNEYRATLVDFESELRTLTLTLDNLKDSIERGLRTLEQRRQNYQIQKNALELANRRVASSTMLQQAGRAEVRDLVEAQDAQIAAQNAVTSALVAYQEARLQLMLDIGALDTQPPKFWLKDHLATYFPETRPPLVGQPAPGDQAVLPPDQYFNN
jgi:outer membrane protein TolC